ncbi:MAG: alpha/beta fold hydrolase [Cyanobacteriota bacterium]|nr:alpha/beta fold hydrolase [Cyanobacteriota bacterium]
MAASLVVGLAVAAPTPMAAAEVLEIQLDSLRVPISLQQLDVWSRQREGRKRRATAESNSEVAAWINLLDQDSQADLRRLLRAPLLRDQSFGRQLLDSWAGSQLLAELGTLLTTPDGQSSTPLLQITLRRLLEERREVSLLEVLRALPEPRLKLQLDGLLDLAHQWRLQLDRQRLALRQLDALPQFAGRGLSAEPDGAEMAEAKELAAATWALGAAGSGAAGTARQPLRMSLAVSGRNEPLPLEIWNPPPSTASGGRRPWLLIMPGLGGTAEQMGWLAAALAERGWPAVVVQHPGSDAAALKATLEGLRPPPGAETLQQRLADLRAVLEAQRQGELPLTAPLDGVVLIGHSLGGVAALLGASLAPEPGLDRRCHRSLNRLPVTNPSLLLQCQLPGDALPVASGAPEALRGVVVFNGFGSLLWPQRGLRSLRVPVLMVGGSLDLVTPPIAEQLELFLPVGHPLSRLVLVDGGSHFSPVRMSAREQALLQLGRELVGAPPELVQALLLRLTGEFLEALDAKPARAFPTQRLGLGPVNAYVLDGAAAAAWRRRLPR